MRIDLTPVGNPVKIRGSIIESDPFDKTFSVKFDFPLFKEDESFTEFVFFVNQDNKIEDTRWHLIWDLEQH